MRYYVVKVDYVRDVINLTLRGEDGNRRIVEVTDYQPHFFVEANEDVEMWYRTEPSDFVDVDDRTKALKKVFVSTGQQLYECKERFKRNSWEVDIPVTQKFIIDTKIGNFIEITNQNGRIEVNDIKTIDSVDISVRRQFYDIEVISSDFCEPSDASAPITSITLYDESLGEMFSWAWNPNREKKFYVDEFYSKAYDNFIPWNVEWCASQQELAKSFCKWFDNNTPDVLLGWNSIEYDAQYIINNFKRIGAQSNIWTKNGTRYSSIPYMQQCDMMEVFKMQQSGEVESVSLKNVSFAICGIELQKNPDNFVKWFNDDPDAFLTYNACDVDATIAIDKKLKLYDFARGYQEYVHVDELMDISKASVVVDVTYVIKAHEMGLALPSRGVNKIDSDSDYGGGAVMDPEFGVHDNVAVIDFSKMYPSIIMGYNISYDTYSTDIGLDVGNGHKFIQDKIGIATSVVKFLVEMRAYYDNCIKTEKDPKLISELKSKRTSVKAMLNAVYGVAGFKGFRLYRKEVAESVTYVGRELIQFVKLKAQELGFNVVYGDTDSIFVKLTGTDESNRVDVARDLSDKLNVELQKYGNEKGINASYLSVDLEKVYDRLFLRNAKKRYAGRIVWLDGKDVSPYMEIKGFEHKRSETANITRELQQTIFDMIFDSVPQEDMFHYVDEIVRRGNNGNIPIKDLATKPKLGKRPENYINRGRVTYMPAKAALYSINNLGKTFHSGDRVYCVYVKSLDKKLPETNVVGITERDTDVPSGIEPDFKLLTEKAVIDKCSSIFDDLGYGYMISGLGTGMIPENRKQVTLF